MLMEEEEDEIKEEMKDRTDFSDDDDDDWIDDERIDNDWSDDEEKVSSFKSLERERSLLLEQLRSYEMTAQFMIEIISNSRWRGRSHLCPSINILTYLARCGGMSRSLRDHLSSLRVLNSGEVGRRMRERVKEMVDEKFKSDFQFPCELEDFSPSLESGHPHLKISFIDNWQKNKRLVSSNSIEGTSTHLSYIVGYSSTTQPTTISLDFEQVNYPFQFEDAVRLVQRINDEGEDEELKVFFANFPCSKQEVSTKLVQPLPPIRANSASIRDVEDHIIDGLFIDHMGGHTRNIISGSDPEPSLIHQKLTNQRLARDSDDPIKHIFNMAGRMHLEMHLLTSIASYAPYYLIILQPLFTFFDYKPGVFKFSGERYIAKIIEDVETNLLTKDPPPGLPPLSDLNLTDSPLDNHQDLLILMKYWEWLPTNVSQLDTTDRQALNLPPFNQLRLYLKKILELKAEIEDGEERIASSSLLSSFLQELDFILSPLLEVQNGISSRFFANFASWAGYLYLNNRKKVGRCYFHFITQIETIRMKTPSFLQILHENLPQLSDELLELLNSLLSRSLTPYSQLTDKYVRICQANVGCASKLLSFLRNKNDSNLHHLDKIFGTYLIEGDQKEGLKKLLFQLSKILVDYQIFEKKMTSIKTILEGLPGDENERVERWEAEGSRDDVDIYLTKLKIGSFRKILFAVTNERVQHLPHLLIKMRDYLLNSLGEYSVENIKILLRANIDLVEFKSTSMDLLIDLEEV